MEVWQSFVLGVIEGITEYLPVSSTGHLVVAQRLMGIGMGSDKTAADAFAVCIQGGAILAVLGLYFRRILKILMGLFGKDPEGLRLAIALVVAFLPAVIVALLIGDKIKEHLFNMPSVVAAWIVGGIAILAVAAWKKRNPSPGGGKDLAELTWKMALVIGLLQCVAMWPGTSRSLMTIVAGMLVGLSLKSAVEFSFLLGVMTLGAATAKDALDYGALMLDTFGPVNLGVGFIASFVFAALAVKWLVSYLQKHGMEIFGWYRIAAGLAVIVLMALGWVHP
jgi:undecaprenyl-diphosphatase